MFAITLVTPEKKVLMGADCEELFVPAFRGELNILPGHAPLLTTLETGVLKYRLKGETQLHYLAVSVGYCQVNPTGVIVMAETAERPDEIDVERAKATYDEANQQVLSGKLDTEAMTKFRDKMTRAQVRQDVAKHVGVPASTTTH